MGGSVPYMRETRRLRKVASKKFTRYYLLAFGIAALIGLLIGVAWVIAGLLRFNVFR